MAVAAVDMAVVVDMVAAAEGRALPLMTDDR